MKHSEFIENKQRGSRDLPVQLYRLSQAHPEYVMPLHWHRELEIIRIISGEFHLFINNTPYTLQEGDIAFVNCGCLHRGEPKDCKYDCIVADLSLLNKKGNGTISAYIEPLISGDCLIKVLHGFDGSLLYASINSLFVILAEQKAYYELAVLGMLYQIFQQLYADNFITKANKDKKGNMQTTAVARLVEWIDDNYSEHITLDLLADRVGMTPNYLCRIFKDYTGKTPIEYVNYVRIEGVCADILNGQKNITTAATNNGYNDLSYFCRVFKNRKEYPQKPLRLAVIVVRMSRTEKVTLTNMCMLYDEKGNILVQNRTNPDWPGITFPGGHVEPMEAFADAVVREMKEETGLDIDSPVLCGVKDWIIDENSRYIVLLYKCNKFSGNLISSKEGDMMWIPADKIKEMPLANDMDELLEIFFSDDHTEQFFEKTENGYKMRII